jgi:nitrate/TMAO reductase-like tetraheme cytochrome c subunit
MFLFLIIMGLITLALLLSLAHHWGPMPVVGRAAMGILVFAVLPVAWSGAVVINRLNSMKTVVFCNSCHVMEPYVASLKVDNPESIPAIHYQNNWVPQQQACYDCHSEYGMFGDVKAKLNGLKHVYVNFISGPPDDIKLYKPYQNSDCLHCHGTAKRFQENEDHVDNMEDINSGETSCLDCHDVGHVLAKGD